MPCVDSRIPATSPQLPRGKQNKEQIMKKILAIIAAIVIAAPAYAGCGKKVASVGTLSAYDAKTKTLTMKVMRTNDPKANKKATNQ